MTPELAQKVIADVKKWGLFICRLNNGDWMVGKANHTYHIKITQDHYADPNVSISRWLDKAVREQIAKIQVRNK